MSTRQTFLLEYEVNVRGLEQAANSANMAQEAAQRASLGLREVERLGTSNLGIMLMATRSVNAFRLAVEQAAKGVMDLNPVALLYSFLNIVQVIRNLAALTRMLTTVTWAQGAAMAFVQTLAGNWWLIPLAVAAVAAVWGLASRSEARASRSLQRGGVVEEEGWYYLHRREIVIPSHYYGPIFVTFERQPAPGIDTEDFLRDLGRHVAEKVRRG